ncbi:sulfite exporter TauE/SafE family protein [Aliigemmobacter aestuarii]|uniref:sulfite exporter TauE/SafE family protein n=1 Tax=Aliigemmobacter aestuarii TaxID=1445661 RepID=UPI001454CA37|nr:sulfite exporter TauE/SafE family protein [Gemmobacter aestuarii]
MLTEAQLLAGQISVGIALAGMAVCFFAGVLGGLSGYGAGLLVTLFIAPIVGPKALIPMISVLMLVNNGSRVWFYRHALDLPTVVKVSAVAMPMSWIGAELYVRLDSSVIQTVLGVVLIASVPLRRWIERARIRPGPIAVYGIGATYGFLASLIVGAGMLIVPMLMGIGFAGPALLATDAAIAAVTNLFKSVVFGALDALSVAHFILALVLGFCTIPGTACAAWIVRRTSLRLHTALIEGLILIGGFGMIFGLI